jgi:hypothetical protein
MQHWWAGTYVQDVVQLNGEQLGGPLCDVVLRAAHHTQCNNKADTLGSGTDRTLHKGMSMLEHSMRAAGGMRGGAA